MKNIRNYAYAALVTLVALCAASTPASAEERHGKFTLAHEVHWQQAVLPAGEYAFSLKEQGPSQVMTVQKLDGDRVGYILLVPDVQSASADEVNRLVLVSRAAGSFVDRMELPEFGVSLHFKVPDSEVAKTATLAAVPSGK
jgi:hypothetical protein